MTRRRVLTLSRAVDRYVAHLELLARRPRGVDTYRDVLDAATDVLGSDIDAALLDRGDWLDVIAHWRGLAPATIAMRVSVIRSFAEWMWEEEITPTNTAARLQRPKKPRPNRPRPPRDDVDLYLRHARNDRERLVVALLAMTGMRLSDLRGLRWEHVHGSTIHVVDGKGGKARRVPAPPALARLLADVRAYRSERGVAAPDHYVVCAWMEYTTPTTGTVDKPRPERPCGINTPQRMLDRIAERAGVRRISPHQLRRAYADRYLASHPGDIVGLAAILGHEHISTTQGYLADAELGLLAERVSELDFVTIVGAELVTDPNTDSSPAAETPDYQGFCGVMEAAGVEPASSGSDTPSARGDEPSSGLVTRPGTDFVTPAEGGEDGA